MEATTADPARLTADK